MTFFVFGKNQSDGFLSHSENKAIELQAIAIVFVTRPNLVIYLHMRSPTSMVIRIVDVDSDFTSPPSQRPM